MSKEINDKYIKERFGYLPQKNVDNLKKSMLKYKDNHWWESNDLVKIATYQIFEDTLIVDFDKFHEGLEKLIGRPIYTHELGLNVEGIREEVKLAIERLKEGIGVSREHVETKTIESIKMLEDYCKKTGKKLIKFNIPKEKPDKDKNEIDNSGYDGWL